MQALKILPKKIPISFALFCVVVFKGLLLEKFRFKTLELGKKTPFESQPFESTHKGDYKAVSDGCNSVTERVARDTIHHCCQWLLSYPQRNSREIFDFVVSNFYIPNLVQLANDLGLSSCSTYLMCLFQCTRDHCQRDWNARAHDVSGPYATPLSRGVFSQV